MTIKFEIRAEYLFTFAGKFKRTKELTHDEEAKVAAFGVKVFTNIDSELAC